MRKDAGHWNHTSEKGTLGSKHAVLYRNEASQVSYRQRPDGCSLIWCTVMARAVQQSKSLALA